MRLALGLGEYIGIRMPADRFRLEYANNTGASNPGVNRLYELVVGFVNDAKAGACFSTPPM